MIKPGSNTSILKSACVVAVVLIGKEQNVLNFDKSNRWVWENAQLYVCNLSNQLCYLLSCLHIEIL